MSLDKDLDVSMAAHGRDILTGMLSKFQFSFVIKKNCTSLHLAGNSDIFS